MAEKYKIDPSNDNFGAVLNCAIRYALGRRSYMPGLVVQFTLPLVSELSDKTIWCICQDIEAAKRDDCLGDPEIDAIYWNILYDAVKAEAERRKELDIP